MIVCHCHAKNDREIRKLVRDGAHSSGSCLRNCAAGRSCGGCVPAIEEIIRSEKGGLPESPTQ